MPRSKTKAPAEFDIAAPIGGVARSFSLQSQPPYTCVECINFWPIDVLDGRRVVATRPPLVARATPGDLVNLLGQINVPEPVLLAASNGVFYRWDGSAWQDATATVGIVANRPVYGAPFFRQYVVFNDGAPLLFDYDDDTLTALVATQGTVPSDCRVGCTSQGALWIGGAPDEPNVFSISRQGDLLDWDFTADLADTGAAFQATGDDFGLITEPITAMAAFTQNETIIGCERSMWVFVGHPRQGGSLRCLSQQSGILGQGAWCITPSGTMYYTSHNGMMMLKPGSIPTPISRDKLPEELIGLEYDYENPTISMAYDYRWNAVIITVRGDDEQSWRYDEELGVFTEMTFSEYPHVLMHFDPFVTEDKSGVLFGGAGYGGLSSFDRTGSEQLETAKMIIGPLKISSSPRYKTMIRRADFLLGGDTDEFSGTATFHCGVTAQVAVYRAQTDADEFKYEVTMNTLANNRKACLPHIAGHAVCLTIEQPANSTKRIVYEGCICQASNAGFAIDPGLVAPVVSVPEAPIVVDTT